ncbi:MAG: hypothetical protein JW795_13510 [Chitinivibrionales bacterium]|nr:hypothetical protein [Chitinivibrionales bacterium]
MIRFKREFIIATLVVSLITAGSLVFWGCSGNNIAGGTIVGNPSTVTSIAILADTGFDNKSESIKPTETMQSREGQLVRHPPKILIHDSVNFSLDITKASMSIQKVLFVLDKYENAEALLKGMKTKLRSDSNTLVLDGPFEFDVLSGISNPPLENIRLPRAHYCGIKLVVDTQFCKTTSTANAPYPIVLGGNFEYRDTVRTFTIKLSFNMTSYYRIWGSCGPSIFLSERDSTLFLIGFSARRWLERTNIRQMIDQKQIELDEKGSLVIDNSTESKWITSLKEQLQYNIIYSGSLYVKKKH